MKTAVNHIPSIRKRIDNNSCKCNGFDILKKVLQRDGANPNDNLEGNGSYGDSYGDSWGDSWR